jgi:hypothetical protein
VGRAGPTQTSGSGRNVLGLGGGWVQFPLSPVPLRTTSATLRLGWQRNSADSDQAQTSAVIPPDQARKAAEFGVGDRREEDACEDPAPIGSSANPAAHGGAQAA